MIEINGNQLFVQDTGGDKPTLLFVHGILMDHSVWRHQVDYFQPNYRVVCVDLRGFGQSTTTDPEISFEDHVGDLLQLIEKLGLKDVTLVGWSMGGAIAQVLGARHPEALFRLVLVDSTPQLLADQNFAHALPVEAAQQLGALLAQDYVQGCQAFCGLVSAEDAQVAAELGAIAARTRPDVALAAFLSSGGRSLLSELTEIGTPTFVICGSEDGICMLGASEYIAEVAPGCTSGVIVIEGAGHAPFLTQPANFNSALERALT